MSDIDLDAGTVKGKAILDTRQWTQGVTRIVKSVDTLIAASAKVDAAMGALGGRKSSGSATQTVQMGAAAEKTAASFKKMRTDADALRDIFRGGAASLWGVSPALGALAGTMGSIHTGALIAAGSFTVLAGIIEGIQFNKLMEQSKVSMGVLIGDTRLANQNLKELMTTARETPLAFSELRDAGTRLLAFGFDATTLDKQLTMLGDVAYGLDQPLNDIVYLYGTIRTQGRAMAQDLNQFANRGIPIYETLAKALGVNVSQVRELASEGKVTFPYVEKAFQLMTEEGGRFNNMLKSQANTFSGLWAAVKDNTSILAGAFSEGIFFTLKDELSWLSNWLTDNTQTAQYFGDALGASLHTLLNGLNFVLNALSAVGFVLSNLTGIRSLDSALLSASVSAGALAAGIRQVTGALGPWGIALSVIFGVISAIQAATDATDLLSARNTQLWQSNYSLIKTYELMGDAQTINIDQYNELIKLYPQLTEKVKAYETTLGQVAILAADQEKLGINKQLGEVVSEIYRYNTFMNKLRVDRGLPQSKRSTGFDNAQIEVELSTMEKELPGLIKRRDDLFKRLSDLDKPAQRYIPSAPPTVSGTGPVGPSDDFDIYSWIKDPGIQKVAQVSVVDGMMQANFSQLDSWAEQFKSQVQGAIASAFGDKGELNDTFMGLVDTVNPELKELITGITDTGVAFKDNIVLAENYAEAIRLVGVAANMVAASKLGVIGGMLSDLSKIADSFSGVQRAFIDGIANIGTSLTGLADSIKSALATIADTTSTMQQRLAAGIQVQANALSFIATIAATTGGVIQAVYQGQIDDLNNANTERMNSLETEMNAEITALNNRYSQGAITAEQYEAGVAQVQQTYAKDKYKAEVAYKKAYDDLAKKQFEAQKATMIAQVWASVGLGIAQAWGSSMQLGPIAGPIAAGVLSVGLLALGAVQTANIAKQKYASPVAVSGVPTIPTTGTSAGGTNGNGGTNITVNFAGAYLRDERMMREVADYVISEVGKKANL